MLNSNHSFINTGFKLGPTVLLTAGKLGRSASQIGEVIAQKYGISVNLEAN